MPSPTFEADLPPLIPTQPSPSAPAARAQAASSPLLPHTEAAASIALTVASASDSGGAVPAAASAAAARPRAMSSWSELHRLPLSELALHVKALAAARQQAALIDCLRLIFLDRPAAAQTGARGDMAAAAGDGGAGGWSASQEMKLAEPESSWSQVDLRDKAERRSAVVRAVLETARQDGSMTEQQTTMCMDEINRHVSRQRSTRQQLRQQRLSSPPRADCRAACAASGSLPQLPLLSLKALVWVIVFVFVHGVKSKVAATADSGNHRLVSICPAAERRSLHCVLFVTDSWAARASTCYQPRCLCCASTRQLTPA